MENIPLNIIAIIGFILVAALTLICCIGLYFEIEWICHSSLALAFMTICTVFLKSQDFHDQIIKNIFKMLNG